MRSGICMCVCKATQLPELPAQELHENPTKMPMKLPMAMSFHTFCPLQAARLECPWLHCLIWLPRLRQQPILWIGL